MTSKLSDVCTIRYGKDHKRLADGKIPVYGSGGVMRYADTAIYSKKSVLIPRKGTLNNLFFVSEPFWTVDTLFYTEIDETKVVPEYLYYFLKTLDLAGMNVGTAVPSLTTTALNEIEIVVPPIDEQQVIADTLSALDARIAENRKINHHLVQIAQAIFKSWFLDFEPFGGAMPDDWRETELGEVTTLNAGGDKPSLYSPVMTEECSVPIFSNGIDNYGLYGYTAKPKITDECVTVSARGTIGFVCLRQEPFVPIVRLVTAIPSNDYITAKYLYLYLRSIHIVGVGTTQQQLTVPDFRKYRILVPSLDIVEKFTEAVDPMFEEIRHKRAENARLAALRDTLLPRLMSGELSVSDYAAK